MFIYLFCIQQTKTCNYAQSKHKSSLGFLLSTIFTTIICFIPANGLAFKHRTTQTDQYIYVSNTKSLKRQRDLIT